MFGKILIANRGEIALRVVRTCREMGVRTVAVYSTVDRDTAAVRMADEAVHIGPSPAKGSYLNHAAVLSAALACGAEAIHPGYGFLAEDPDFAAACEETGVNLIGPPAEVMYRLGSKISARELMTDTGMRLLPGSMGRLDAASAQRMADDIGYPVVIKASAGGGGRGITVVTDPAEFVGAFRRTRATAKMLFGDDQVYLERYLTKARHVEVQVLCDSHGGAVHLGTRDCTIQRRHQKLLEEAPAPALPDDLAEEMGRAAVRGAIAAGYVGAGTFEFLVDGDGGFYFMEVNCRIQVEHPVTEAVTGLDLVREQLGIAAGEGLRFGQEQVRLFGVGLECRVNAEDPAAGFAPAPGRLTGFTPAGGPFVRVDSHASTGCTVPPDYDSLLAKLIVWAPDRDGAIARMRRALCEFEVTGVPTTIGFMAQVIDHPAFRSASHDTGLVARMIG